MWHKWTLADFAWFLAPEQDTDTNAGPGGGGGGTPPTPSFESARKDFLDKAKEQKIFNSPTPPPPPPPPLPGGEDDKKEEDKKEDVKAEDDKKEEVKEGEEEAKAEDDKEEEVKEGEEDVKAEDDKEEEKEEDKELSEEDKDYVRGLLEEADEQEKIAKSAVLFKSNITPGTSQWLEGLREKRLREREEINQLKQRVAVAGEATADPDKDKKAQGAEATGDPVKDQLEPLNVNPPFRTIKNVEELSRFDGDYLTRDFVQQFGIDPDKMPARFNKAISKLINMHNEAVANSTFLFGESKKAFKSRDELKGRLWDIEYQGALREAGFPVNEATKALSAEVRKLTFVNGKRQSWDSVFGKLTMKMPEVFKKSGGETKSQPAAGDKTPTVPQDTKTETKVPATPGGGPIGTRTRKQGSPPVHEGKIKTMEDAKRAFATQFKKENLGK